MRRLELDILFAATRLAILLLVPLHISDLSGYEDYARHLFPRHEVPYLHWDFEYPPLAYLFISVPAWVHDLLGLQGTEWYRLLFGACLLPFDVLIYRALRRRPTFRGAPFAYVLLSSSMAVLLFDRFDLLIGFLVAWPFLSPREKPEGGYALWWGLGAATKLVPLALAPVPFLGWLDRRAAWKGKGRRLVAYAFAAGVPLLASCALAAALGKGKISFLSHHSQRGVQIESLVGSAVLWLQSWFHAVDARIDTNFGAQHLEAMPRVIAASRAVFFGMLASTYLTLWWHRRRVDVLTGAWLVLSAFVTFGYVLSPQFLLWLLPLGLCAAARVPEGRPRQAWLLVFAACVILTGAHFRYYWDYVNLHRLNTALVLGRNLLLVALWGLSWRWMRAPTGASLAESALSKF